jgi:hypothetical protein
MACCRCDPADADVLRQRLDEAREIVVVGAGFIGQNSPPPRIQWR